MPKTDIIARLALLLATLIWGSSFIIMKDALDNIGTFFLLAVRFTGACILLTIVFFKKLKKLNKEVVKAGFVMGTALITAYILQTFGLAETTPGKNAFLTAGYCILVPFMFWAVAGTRPDRYNIIAAVLCIAGIGLVALDDNLTMGRGDVLTLMCCAFYALHIIVSARYTQTYDVMLLTLLQFFFAALWSSLLCVLFEPVPAVAEIPPYTWFSLGYLCVFATAGALLMQTYGLKYTSPSAGALILSLESVFGVIFSIMVGAEAVTARLLLGFAVIFVAIVISETKLEFLLKKKHPPKYKARMNDDK
ncbi:MAG: DMT family transporter [Peptococcaceae bacterium]|nr:DMT family transporter [Peptococcaceae bacterium]